MRQMDFEINTKCIERLTEKIGDERNAEVAADVATYVQLPLMDRKRAPEGVTAPDLAVVSVDGGRFQVRDFDSPKAGKSKDAKKDAKTKRGAKKGAKKDANESPAAETSAATATATAAKASSASAATDEEKPEPDAEHKGTHWREDKIGLLMTMASQAQATDPCPELPPTFGNPTRIVTLVREMKTKKSATVTHDGEEQAAPSKFSAEDEEAGKGERGALHGGSAGEPVRWQPPKVVDKEHVATQEKWAEFGPVVAQAAWKLGFYGAARKAFVADGSDNNWSMWKNHFSSFTPILDIIHAISYVFAAATAGRPFKEGWQVYLRWVTWVWQGSVEKVVAELAARQAELGLPQESDGDTHPRVVVTTALGYLQNHKGKMRYAEYRREGLPITSSYVESAVKQFNRRVKGSEKFWTRRGAESLLQLRADNLSGAKVMAGFWDRRQARATGLNSYPQQSVAA